MIYTAIERDTAAFQKPLTADQVHTICATAFGSGVAVERVTEIAAGMFNNTFLVNIHGRDQAILRVAPTDDVFVFSNESELMRREHSVEPFLSVLGNLVPRTLFADFSREIIPRDYVIQTFIEGELWDEAKDSLSDAENADLWRQLGEISSVIHQVTGSSFGFPPPKRPFSQWSTAVVDIVRGMQQDLITLSLDDDRISEFVSLLQDGAHFLDAIDQPRLIHGDLWPKNVLFHRTNGRATITGLLDSERAFWGDPMAEWIYVLLDIPEAYWEGYGPRMQSDAARFRKCAYRGLYSVQLFLEAWRFKYDDGFARQNLADAIIAMRGLLP